MTLGLIVLDLFLNWCVDLTDLLVEQCCRPETGWTVCAVCTEEVNFICRCPSLGHIVLSSWLSPGPSFCAWAAATEQGLL